MRSVSRSPPACCCCRKSWGTRLTMSWATPTKRRRASPLCNRCVATGVLSCSVISVLSACDGVALNPSYGRLRLLEPVTANPNPATVQVFEELKLDMSVPIAPSTVPAHAVAAPARVATGVASGGPGGGSGGPSLPPPSGGGSGGAGAPPAPPGGGGGLPPADFSARLNGLRGGGAGKGGAGQGGPPPPAAT